MHQNRARSDVLGAIPTRGHPLIPIVSVQLAECKILGLSSGAKTPEEREYITQLCAGNFALCAAWGLMLGHYDFVDFIGIAILVGATISCYIAVLPLS